MEATSNEARLAKTAAVDLRGRGVLVTGASRGLGRALSEQLAELGAKVVMVARASGPLEDAAAEIRARGYVAHALAADVGDKDAIHRIAGVAAALVGPIDLLVHDASALGRTPLRLLLDTDCEDLERVLAVNVVGPFRLTKAIAGSMVMRGEGTIVAISSDAATNAYPRWGAYGTSKAAFDHMQRILAAELAPSGLRVLTIDPGEMDTDMHRDAFGAEHDPSQLARPETVAKAIVDVIRRAEHGARVEVATWRGGAS
jgi:NAD(P)-dependent dehydrogenase (short-subunit alcohol dehydrogenase family)